jgi:hypothetical protein
MARLGVAGDTEIDIRAAEPTVKVVLPVTCLRAAVMVAVPCA